MGKRGLGAKEVEQIVVDFERSGLSRREYGELRGIPVVTLDWYRRKVRAGRSSSKLVPVKLAESAGPVIGGGGMDGLTLVLPNGRRIEAGWNFNDDAMERLIRIAGAV